MTAIFRKCRKCGLEAHIEEELELFAKDKQAKYGRTTLCKECARENTTKWYNENKERCIEKNKEWHNNNKERQRQNQQERIKRNREALKEYIGGTFKCEYCGFEHPTSAPFDFHHINPDEKENSVGNLVQGSSLERLFKEVDKCVFLCKNCHALEHERLRNNDSDF